MQQTGYAPLLDSEWQSGDAVELSRQYLYRIPEGPELTDSSKGLTVSGNTLLELHNEQFDQLSNMKEARDLARALLHYQLNGRELLSRSLFTSMHKLQATDRG